MQASHLVLCNNSNAGFKRKRQEYPGRYGYHLDNGTYILKASSLIRINCRYLMNMRTVCSLSCNKRENYTTGMTR
jgi:hypothetical protein